MNNFTQTKNLFMNEDGEYIALQNSQSCYEKICEALQKPLKIILFYGKPGSGKTFLLHKIIKDLSPNFDILYFSSPFFSEKEFIFAMCKKIYGNFIEGVDSFENFMYYYTQNFTHNDDEKLKFQKTIILDEAQLYPNDLIEKIRLMADSRYFKFLFTVHKTNDEELLAKDHFTTRIWESIELKDTPTSEIKLYLLKRLKSSEIVLNDDDIDLASKFCKSNLRELNKLMYKFCEICESYEKHRPSTLAQTNFNQKALHMAAISLGVIK
ncbi:MAG: ATP-binding protein [Campylobacter sp.]|nr:ATP-binding protein [Campylobacter sp.]